MTQTHEQKLEATRAWRVRQAHKTIACVACGETLRRRSGDGLCGFCRDGIPMDESSPNWKGAA